MPQTVTKVGPQDHGRPMSLAEFDRAEGQEGFLYELYRGIVVVSDIPDFAHFSQFEEIRDQLVAFKLSNPGQIYRIGGGSECKILLPKRESERHPDIAVYTTRPSESEHLWKTWIPDLVIEIVSAASEERDYVEKRADYWEAGVKEYWIVDAAKQEMLVLTRSRGKWKERIIRPAEIYSTKLLPGFAFDLAKVFSAAE
jgi:Uma2 family endonuclease